MAIRFVIGLGCLYAFICSLDVLQDSFQLLSGEVINYIRYYQAAVAHQSARKCEST